MKLIMLATECSNFGVEQKGICEQAMMNIGWGVEDFDEAMSQAGTLRLGLIVVCLLNRYTHR